MSYRRLSAAAIGRGLQPQIVGRDIVCLPRVGSTNDWIRSAAAEGTAEGIVVLAEEQTAGRGQVGRRWVAPPGTCLLFSTLLRPHLAATRLFAITAVGACAAAAAIEETTGLTTDLKWPNDVLGADGKLAGVLAEAALIGDSVAHVVLGIGINVNLSRRALKNIPGAASLQAMLGRPINRNALARALIRHVDTRYVTLETGGEEPVLGEWRRRLVTIGHQVTLDSGDGPSGPYVARATTGAGALVLERPNGSTFQIVAGEVSVRSVPSISSHARS